MRSRLCAAVLAVAALLGGALASASEHPAPVHWEQFLPALPSPSDIQPGPVPHCRKSSPKCIDVQIKRMRELQKKLGCDHRAVFTTTYLELTKTYRRILRDQPDYIKFRKYLFTEVAVFANVYFRSVRDYNRGKDVPEAWKIAFDTARDADVNATQDMLLGINAHVQNDMPFVIAALGVRTKKGETRKPDHDKVNDVLDDAYLTVVEAVRKRFDSQVGLTNPVGLPHDDILGIELVRTWREGVWRNAERLVNAKTDEERAQVAQQIEDQAAMWARGMAAVEQPGYRATRDEYCATAMAGR
jgi:hypothetical protein